MLRDFRKVLLLAFECASIRQRSLYYTSLLIKIPIPI